MRISAVDLRLVMSPVICSPVPLYDYYYYYVLLSLDARSVEVASKIHFDCSQHLLEKARVGVL